MKLHMVSFPLFSLLVFDIEITTNICFLDRLSLPIRTRQDPMSLWVGQVSWILELTTGAVSSRFNLVFVFRSPLSHSVPHLSPFVILLSFSHAVLPFLVLCVVPHLIPQPSHQLYISIHPIIVHSTAVALSYIWPSVSHRVGTLTFVIIIFVVFFVGN